MLMDKYSFYDMHSVLVGIRFKPDNPCNAEIARAIYEVLSEPQKDNLVELNIIRKALAKIDSLDDERFYWVHTENIYTYGWKFIKEDLPYRILAGGFSKISSLAESRDLERLEDLADALHNVPILFADGCKNLKKAVKIEFHYYNKKYKTDLWKELAD